MQASDNNFSAQLERRRTEIDAFLADKGLRIIRVEGLNHFQDSFQNEGFTNRALVKWKQRKIPKGKNGKPIKGKALESWQHKNQDRAILVGHNTDTKGGHLKDSLSAEIAGDSVIFSSDKPYSGAHNDGGLSGRLLALKCPNVSLSAPARP
jgi:Mu-like prophage protein gpG